MWSLQQARLRAVAPIKRGWGPQLFPFPSAILASWEMQHKGVKSKPCSHFVLRAVDMFPAGLVRTSLCRTSQPCRLHWKPSQLLGWTFSVDPLSRWAVSTSNKRTKDGWSRPSRQGRNYSIKCPAWGGRDQSSRVLLGEGHREGTKDWWVCSSYSLCAVCQTYTHSSRGQHKRNILPKLGRTQKSSCMWNAEQGTLFHIRNI